ncbi:MAG: chromate transporter, partial [Ekhidna sp.]|nr:chromate transporter [Ekhidna sp.]
CSKVINTRLGFALMLISAAASYVLKSPYAFPILIILGGVATTWRYKQQSVEEKERIKINWSNLILWGIVFVSIAVLGGITRFQPILILENFYRNGSMIFGGGQVLVPLLYTEFVEFKEMLTKDEFIHGYGMVQAVPGPTFSFSAYVGALSIDNMGIGGRIFGAVMAVLGIFLPGTFLIFFVIRFWEQLKKYRIVKASLEGINAVSAGMVIAAACLILVPMKPSLLNYGVMTGTAFTLLFTKFPTPIIIIGGLILGIILA